MEISPLSGKEICDIINQCQTSGVVDFSLGELKFSFDVNKNKTLASEPYQGDTDFIGKDREPPEMGAMDEKTREDMESTQLLIDDPTNFEQSIIDSHLNNEQGSSYDKVRERET